MRRIKLSFLIPFVLGIFIGTLITTFLILAVQSIDEEPNLQGDITDAKAELSEEEIEEYLPEISQKRAKSPSQLVSYNVLTSREAIKEGSFFIHQTWGSEKAINKHINYYVHPFARKEEADFAASRKMSIVSLLKESDTHQGTGVFEMWTDICHRKSEKYLWFVKTRDNVYLKKKNLESLLSVLNSSEPMLLGRQISPSGKTREDLGLREDESYCHEACYILSWKAMEKLCSNLESCQENARSTNEDVEIARCLKIHADINCTAATETAELFYSAENAYEVEELQTGEHGFNYKVNKAITLTPLTKSEHFYHLHHYYAKTLLETTSTSNTQKRARIIQINELGAQSDSLLHTNEQQSPSWTKLGINPPHKPSNSTQDHVMHFQAIDTRFVYTESKYHPVTPISDAEYKAINGVFKDIVQSQITHGHMSNESTVTLESGLKRVDPGRGVDYFLQITEVEKKGFINRVFLHGLREFLPFQVISLKSADYKSTKVNFVVSTPSVSRGFQRFIMSFENSFLARKPPELVGMLVIMYSDGKFGTYDTDLFAVSTLVNLYQKKYPEADFRLITRMKQYSRAGMLRIASEEYPSYELLFLADIHIDVSMQFLERCRMNAIEDKQVYFPSAFNPYDPSEFYQEKLKYPFATKFQISADRGSWMRDNFHIACLYNYDLMKVFGDGRDMAGEEEDGAEMNWRLVDKLVEENGVSIFRSVEPGLVHLWQDGCKEADSQSLEERYCKHLKRLSLAMV